MQMPANGNGTITRWILGITMPTLLGSTIGWVTSINLKLAAHGEHIAVIQAQLQDTRDELRRINTKLDQLFEHRRP
jgi:hypothetical protein